MMKYRQREKVSIKPSSIKTVKGMLHTFRLQRPLPDLA